MDFFGLKWYFKGLEVFFDEIVIEEESEIFFKIILFFIVILVLSIEEFVLSEGILFSF